MSRGAPLALLASLALTACDAPARDEGAIEVEPGLLVDADGWVAVAASEDPLAEHRPWQVVCPEQAWGVEFGSLEVDTGACNYLGVEQPLSRDVPADAAIVVNLWHQPLYAEHEAKGHLALLIGDELMWEREVDIPGPAAILRDELRAPRDLSAGERVVFHIHNHGANTWNLGEVAFE